MLNIIQNTIGAIRRVGESVVRAGLKMWLPFTKADVGATTQTTPDISGNDNNAVLKTGKALKFHANDSLQTSFPTSKDIKTIAFWIYPTASNTNETLFWFGGSSFDTKYVLLNHLTLVSSAYRPTDFDVYVDGVFAGATNGGVSVTLTQDQWQRVVFKSSTAINVTDDTLDVAAGAAAGGQFIMSDLQVYGAEWTTDDIAYDYANPQKLVTDNASSNITLNDLHAWWHMSEGDGTIAFDSAPLLGVEEITNGNFESDSDWTVIDGGWTISNNEACHTGSASFIEQNTNLISGRTYKVVWTISSLTNQSAGISSNSGTRSGDFSKSAEGTYVAYLVSNGNNFRFFSTGDNCIGSVSVKEVFNIDGETYDGSSLGATYVDAQERIPQLGMMNWSKGSNLIEYSEDISEWNGLSGAVVSFDSDIVNPDGTVGCYKVTFDGTFKGRVEYNVAIDGTVVQSVYLRVASGTQAAKIGGASTSLGDVTVTDQWQRFSHSATYSATSTNPRVRCDDAAVIYVWGAQYEYGTTASAYRRTNGTAVTDATLISSATDSQKDILNNAVRVKGNAFNLDGTGYAEILDNNVFDIPGCNSDDEGAFSFMGWSKFNYTVQAASSFNVIYSHGLSMTSVGSFAIASENNNKMAAFVSGNYITTTTTQNIGDWVHFALTRDVNGSVKLYINKTLENTITQTNSLSNSGSKKVGWDSTANDRFYNERIDDLKFYNTELSLDEIKQNYNATKSGHNN